MIYYLRKILLLTLLITAAPIFISHTAYAAPVVGFDAGRIIDDVVMTNQSMGVSQIQAFLNSKVPVCDNWGTNGTTSTSRRDYFIRMGYPLPLTCLKDYQENDKTSAQIIYDAAQEYNINPQVLIVLLQKEQGLVTDDWPDPMQYRKATGYGCPDTAACDSDYYGFTNQVRSSARMFRSILNGSPKVSYTLGNNYIQYNPIVSCGGTTVNIQNRSTQALYNYTPYQPNASSLNAGYGSGDSCGAYGNRNFYLYFNDWFGSTTAINGSVTITKGLSIDKPAVYVGDTITASYEVSNSAGFDVQVGGLGICARQNGINVDFGWKWQNNVLANGKNIISYSRLIDKPGDLYVFICSYNDQLGGWANSTYPYNPNNLLRTINTLVKENPLVTSGVTLNPYNPSVGQPVVVNFVVTNNSSIPVTIDEPMVAVRSTNGIGDDFPIEGPITIQANSTYTYTKTKAFTTPGWYYYFISNRRANGSFELNYPKNASDSISRSGMFFVK